MLPGMTDFAPLATATPPWHVVCVCASWCGVCRDFAPTFAALAQAHPGTHFHWLDLEEHAELLDELEVDNFPTLLLGTGQQLVFHGPVLPHVAGLHRLLREAVHLPPLPCGSDTNQATNAQALRVLQQVQALPATPALVISACG